MIFYVIHKMSNQQSQAIKHKIRVRLIMKCTELDRADFSEKIVL